MKIIITGHGNFGSGLYSSLKLVFGINENIKYVDFIEGMSYEELKNKIELEIEREQKNIILTDIKGGSPFRVGAELSINNSNIVVMSGTNIPLLLEIASEMDEEIDIEEVIENAKNSIDKFELVQKEEIIEEDGI